MNITYTCRQCEGEVAAEVKPAQPLVCPHCNAETAVADMNPSEPLKSCLVCGCSELFVRKDFSQRLGVTIVVVGLLASTIAWGFHWRYVSYAILFASALCDVLLYFIVGNVLQCYRCHAEYRGLARLEEFEPFDLETHEKFRQQALRMAQAKRA